ncbi:cadherin-like protein 26 isoform X2 [Latimeria chalumnae]|uniref:cadherin-like protein 26 isoform X2 n=1 Tax=Latimeria chalumnae TaxID=7897 RepID=UPI0003C117FE|nr:PREDICTED: cadherin-like protein 26 isoform X2 [Latimeria chalumnae]|eukprot:XP_005993645.1 PREDICTED: cadherin-like protein 26 isoform X2 [Latimeria chalumnae]
MKTFVLLLLVNLFSGLLDSFQLLRRTKRRWVLATIDIVEGDPGPFPKKATQLDNDRGHKDFYVISGPGVDIMPEKGLFTVNKTDGTVFVHWTIDREKVACFKIQFDVLDKKGKVIDDSLYFNVEVKDINDNEPRFEQKEYHAILDESQEQGNTGFKITAHDPDNGNNATVTYSVISQDPAVPDVKFDIDPQHGTLLLKGCLNYQDHKTYKLVVMAKDNGTPKRLSSTTTLTIDINDKNNHAPTIIAGQDTVDIDEFSTSDELLRLTVKDEDSPNTPAWRAKFIITQGNEFDNYKIETDPVTNEGILKVVKPVDYENSNTKPLNIIVENEEPFFECEAAIVPKSTTPRGFSLKVNVRDVNDPPEINTESTKYSIIEGMKPGTKVGDLHATDPENNNVRYIKVVDLEEWFKIDEKTGALTCVKEVDRESPHVNNSIYPVIFHAIDDGKPPQTATGTVFLHIRDENDNKPYLVAKYVELCENSERPSTIVRAADADIDPFSGPFTFELIDAKRQLKDKWKLENFDDESVKLLTLKSIPNGNYTLPLKIHDRQGTEAEETLTVRVCTCHKSACEEKAVSSGLTGSAIGIIVASLLLLLLALCLLSYCLSGSAVKKRAGFNQLDDGNQTLIKYNEEGGGADCNDPPQVMMPNNVSGATPMWAGADNIENRKGCGNIKASTSGYMLQQDSGAIMGSAYLTGAGSGQELNTYPTRATSVYSQYNIFTQTVTEMINQKVNQLSEREDDDEVAYKPHVYAYEGNIQKAQSLDALSIADADSGLDFVNNLGPKFSVLERICQKEHVSE